MKIRRCKILDKFHVWSGCFVTLFHFVTTQCKRGADKKHPACRWGTSYNHKVGMFSALLWLANVLRQEPADYLMSRCITEQRHLWKGGDSSDGEKFSTNSSWIDMCLRRVMRGLCWSSWIPRQTPPGEVSWRQRLALQSWAAGNGEAVWTYFTRRNKVSIIVWYHFAQLWKQMRMTCVSIGLADTASAWGQVVNESQEECGRFCRAHDDPQENCKWVPRIETFLQSHNRTEDIAKLTVNESEEKRGRFCLQGN